MTTCSAMDVYRRFRDTCFLLVNLQTVSILTTVLFIQFIRNIGLTSPSLNTQFIVIMFGEAGKDTLIKTWYS